jgi:hypothetical protein
MHRRWRQHRYSLVIVLVVVPIKKTYQELPSILDGFQFYYPLVDSTVTLAPRYNQIQWVPRLGIAMSYAVGPGWSPRLPFVPLAAIATRQAAVSTASSGFGWFVNWISSVVILDLCNSASLNSERGCRELYVIAPCPRTNLILSPIAKKKGSPPEALLPRMMTFNV